MHDGIPVARKILSHIFDDFIVLLVSTSKFLAGLNIFDLCLLGFNPTKSVAMPSIEISLLTIPFQTNGVWVQRMKPGKCFDYGEPADYTPCQQITARC